MKQNSVHILLLERYMENNNISILKEVSSYYSKKLATYGQTPLGVDWNGEESQFIRFEQLCKVINSSKSDLSINDIGCGYGALLDYLLDKYSNLSYTGIDISEDMITSAQMRYSINNIEFINASKPNVTADYGIASGIFNVRLERTDAEWYDYLQEMLDILDQTSNKGFAFNCLTSYSDEDKKRDYLYYADPCQLFDICKRRYSRQIALLHDYGLYEFTIIVRKT